MAAIATISGRNNVREVVRLTLPKEHGSWSLALEPLALGILVAPSAAGGVLLLTAFAAFLLRRPLKIVLAGKPDPRFWRAFAIAIALSLLAIAGLLATMTMGGIRNLWPLIPAAIAGLGFAWFDSRNESRQEAAELCGATAFGALPATFGTLAGWPVAESFALAAVMLVRSVSTVLFVRTYLRRKKGYATNRAPAFVVVGLGFFITAFLVFSHLAPWPVMAFAFLLAAGTFWVLRGNHQFSARKIGFAEMIFGLLMIFTLALTWKAF